MISTWWPKPPPLPFNVMQELDLHGTDAMRAILASSTDGYSGTTRQVSIELGTVRVTRGDIQDWLKWKSARDACWIKVGIVAAVAAALFSFLALWK
jgi:hypothetical protein